MYIIGTKFSYDRLLRELICGLSIYEISEKFDIDLDNIKAALLEIHQVIFNKNNLDQPT